MHHPRSTSSIRSFQLAAVLLLGNFLLAPAAFGVLIHALLHQNRQWIMVGTSLGILSLVLVIVQWTAASDTGCPLCRTPVLAHKHCMKHRRARAFAGSHRLRVALTIFFKNRFRCPYCNESTTMELRETLGGTHPRNRRFSPAED